MSVWNSDEREWNFPGLACDRQTQNRIAGPCNRQGLRWSQPIGRNVDLLLTFSWYALLLTFIELENSCRYNQEKRWVNHSHYGRCWPSWSVMNVPNFPPIRAACPGGNKQPGGLPAELYLPFHVLRLFACCAAG